MGIGKIGGDWGLGPIPNPQSPSPKSPIPNQKKNFFKKLKNNIIKIINKIIY